ncbi:MAG: helix-turn-helix transcriptional regulator [Lachnospiraceae bacterium]|nr:helix-turn-helix transcriptional regulator [Lachnospiraceae bacterium]
MYFNQVEFGKRIRELRKLKGLTQEALAIEMNVSYDHIKKIEMGIRACSLDLLVEFGSFFDVSIDFLLTGKDYEDVLVKKRLEAVLNELTNIVQGMA